MNANEPLCNSVQQAAILHNTKNISIGKNPVSFDKIFPDGEPVLTRHEARLTGCYCGIHALVDRTDDAF